MSRCSCVIIISSIDAAGARWNGQPEARQEWPCHQGAAFSLVGTARRRAEAGALASQGYVSELDPRAPFPRQATLTPALNPGISAGLQIRIRGGVPNWRLGLTANQRGKLHALEDLLSYAIRPKRVA